MTVQEFNRLKAGMAIYCAACNEPHLAERRHLWLEAVNQPLGQLPEEIARELRASGVKGAGAPAQLQ